MDGQPSYPPDFDEKLRSQIDAVRPFTMTTPERLFGLASAIDYVVARRIPGAIVECGVWRGGSMMFSALRLLDHRATDRELVLMDTFEGMAPPTDDDVDVSGRTAARLLEEDTERTGWAWAVAGEDDVRHNMATTGYPPERIRFVRGRVEDTVPAEAPDVIALLRLDTDWYESTMHELEHLVPRVSPGGVLIIDDYGHWQGAKRAVDEYFADKPVLLHRLDYTGRMTVLP